MTDRQGLTWQQTYFKRVISLSTTCWFFSLLNEQWWRERSADGLVTELRVMQVRGHRVAGLLLEEDFSSLWVVEVVDHVGPITYGRSSIGQRARVLFFWRSSAVFVDRQRDLRGCSWWRDRGEDVSLKSVDWEQVKCAGANMDDMVRTLFLCGPRNLELEPTHARMWIVRALRQLRADVSTVLWTTEQKPHTMNWRDKRVLLKWKDRHSLLTWNRTRELYKDIRSLCSRTCWEPPSHIPNTVRSPNVSGQWSRKFQPLCFPYLDSPDSQSDVLGLFALNEWITEGTGDLQSLWPASSENVLVNLLLLHCGHCLWDWTFPHGSRKQQTNVCTD